MIVTSIEGIVAVVVGTDGFGVTPQLQVELVGVEGSLKTRLVEGPEHDVNASQIGGQSLQNCHQCSISPERSASPKTRMNHGSRRCSGNASALPTRRGESRTGRVQNVVNVLLGVVSVTARWRSHREYVANRRGTSAFVAAMICSFDARANAFPHNPSGRLALALGRVSIAQRR